MRMLLTVEFPHERFNTLVRSGEVGQLLGRILDEIKPEAAYFTEERGTRCGVFVINVQNSSEIPRFAEPFFLNFEADCKFRIAMRPEELQEAGIEELGKKWSGN
jgi:hypothetical protein